MGATDAAPAAVRSTSSAASLPGGHSSAVLLFAYELDLIKVWESRRPPPPDWGASAAWTRPVF
ncbi:hypothetical protein [Pelobacter propionicus]|uniref:hypothetical protein n=1 Tax=Pelobacter propionicus TaxID=29543 RepID=UPI0012EDD747|nr:hypothetical protein [Pelobacter propionicus]